MLSHRLSTLRSTTALKRPGLALRTSTAVLAACLGVASVHAKLPENLGPGLEEITTAYTTKAATAGGTLSAEQFSAILADHQLARADDKNRVMVDIYFDGTVLKDDVIKSLKELGCTITARVDWYRHGVVSAYMPLTQTAAVATTPGVNAVNLDSKPVHRVGKATSQGTVVLKSNTVNAEGYLGVGITVGALSDSFNTAKNGATQPTTTATTDVTNGDLPGTGNPNGYTTPVNVLEDYGSTAATAGTDEGRAMLQIVSDMAPAAALAFATGDVSEVGFAQNIVALATPTNQTVTIPASTATVPASTSGTITVNGAGCQVICDDLGYFDEPMFSDGVVAQAVERASNLYGVSYFSSAGNDGSSGYEATYSPQPNNSTNEALLSSQGGITYASIPATETAVIESFHSFGTNAAGQPILVQKVMQPKTTNSSYNGSIIFQWDDPYNAVNAGGVNEVTTDFDILTFSVNATTGLATYQATRSGTKNNFSTNEPLEEPTSKLTAGTQYEFVIVRTNRAPGTGITPNQATHIRWAVESDASAVIADFVTPNSVESYGHNCASTANGMAAYIYDDGFNYLDSPYIPLIEAFSSNGPTMIFFDSAGNRLSTPVNRKQPTFATVDGVDTSFFGSDSDGDGLPNFFGTSAAGPHAAGCAALILNAAAANGIALGWQDVRTLLISTTQGQQDLDPAQSNATAGPVAFNATFRSSGTDPDAYTITYTGPTGSTLTSLVFDLTTIPPSPPTPAPINYCFFAGFYPVTTGQKTTATGTTAPSITSATLSNDESGSTTDGQTETLALANFNPGDSLAFGVAVGTYPAGNVVGGDQLAGAAITATVTNADGSTSTYTGTLGNTLGRQWNVKSGYGLIDVNAAVNRLLGQ